MKSYLLYNIKEIIRSIKGIKKSPFKNLKVKYYFGKLKYGTPYFFPINFNPHIISIRKLELRTEEEYNEYLTKYPYEANTKKVKFSNYPLVRRTKHKIIKIFNKYYYVEIGWPINIYANLLGWKDKYGSPRFEWNPALYFHLFNLQFCIFFIPPINDIDLYWEMYLWYDKYCNRFLGKAKETWGWMDYDTKMSTWNDNYLN